MKNYHRCATIFASVLTCVEGIAWLVVAVLSITIYTCHTNFPGAIQEAKLDTLWYRAYFIGPCIGLDESTLPPSAFRTYVFMILYSITSALWIPGSVLLLAGTLMKISGPSAACVYLPWILLTAFIQFLDLTATIFSAIDISQTTTTQGFTDFLKPYVFDVSSKYDGITVLPAIFMTLFYSRGIIIWLINIIFLGVVVQSYAGLVRERKTRQKMESREERNPPKGPSPDAGRWVVASDRYPPYTVQNNDRYPPYTVQNNDRYPPYTVQNDDRYPPYSRQNSDPGSRPYSPEKYPSSPQITHAYSKHDPSEFEQRSKMPFSYHQPNQQPPYIPRPDYPVESKVNFYPPQNQNVYPIIPRVRSGSFSSSTSGGLKPNSGGY